MLCRPVIDSHLTEGDRLGRYTIIRQLGAGGMGVVYEARDASLERAVALKVLPDAFSANEERRARFLREARSAAAVSHRNIAMVHEVGEHDGRVFIAMELIVGETLGERIARDGVRPDRALLIAIEIARALAKAHDAGVVHRDLKPSNVMLDDDGGVKVLDFGLAKRIAEDEEGADEVSETVSAITQEGRVLGTPGYMAPEQAEGRALGPPADVFAIGAILYEMLTGTMAFGGRSTAVRIAATLKDDPPPVSERVVDLPRAFEEIVHACLEKEPSQRPANAGVLLERLEALTEDMSSVPRITVRPPTPPGTDAATLGEGETQLANRRRAWPWWPALVVLALVAGVAVWRLTPQPDPAPAAPTESFASFIAKPESVSACPIWEVEGGGGPPGRLGAAAATQACADWSLLTGRRDKRSPARLLELPVLPVDDFPAHPYAAEDARARSLTAAKKVAVVLDGKVIVREREFEVRIDLSRVGERVATSTQKDRVLDIAIHRAVRELAATVGLGEDAPLPEGLDELTRCRVAGCYLDMASIDDKVVDGLDVEQSCAALAKADPVRAGARAAECGHVGRREDGLPVWPANLKAALDELPEVGRVFWSGILRIHTLTPEQAKAEAARVRPLREAAGERTTFIPLAVIEAVLLFRAGDTEQAAPLLNRAYRLEPTNCDSRIMSYELSLEGDERVFLARAATGWCPSVAYAWKYQYAAERGDDRDLELLRTSYHLRARSMSAGISLADALMVDGRHQEARLIAARYLGGTPQERLGGAYLQARLDIAEGRIGAGLDQLVKLIEKQETFGRRDVHHSDWGGLFAALEMGLIVGRSQRIADMFLERFLLDESFPVASSGPFGFVFAASFASPDIALKAIERIEALTEAGKLWRIDGVNTWMEGVARYQRGDAEGAADALRTFVGNPTFRPFIRAEIFDAAGETELASMLDEKGIAVSGELVFFGYAREAKRAHARGDVETARRYAKKFVDAWSTADVKVEHVAEMRKLAGSALKPDSSSR